MNPKQLGQMIKELRKQQNMTQSELAERINVSFQQVQKYEQGRSRITLQRLGSIADALKVPAGVFLEPQPPQVSEPPGRYEKDRVFHLTDEEAALVRHFRRISNRKVRKALIGLVKGIGDSKPA
jgi:transcriptional regulator with XRE-family HTH domain